jgi:hypothetical protein
MDGTKCSCTGIASDALRRGEGFAMGRNGIFRSAPRACHHGSIQFFTWASSDRAPDSRAHEGPHREGWTSRAEPAPTRITGLERHAPDGRTAKATGTDGLAVAEPMKGNSTHDTGGWGDDRVADRTRGPRLRAATDGHHFDCTMWRRGPNVETPGGPESPWAAAQNAPLQGLSLAERTSAPESRCYGRNTDGTRP